MKYQVIRTCYYNNRLYQKGDVVTLEGSVPEHFSPLPDSNKGKPTRANRNKTAIRGE